MEEYEDEDLMFDNSAGEDFSQRDDEDEEDPQASAFMRGVREAQQIKESSADPDEEEEDFI